MEPNSNSLDKLTDHFAQAFLAFEADAALDAPKQCDNDWVSHISKRIDHAVSQQQQDFELFDMGLAAFYAFLQANVTGPPLLWDSAKTIFPSQIFLGGPTAIEKLRKQLISSLSVDGEAMYQLTPNIELFYLAKCILNNEQLGLRLGAKAILARVRINFWHQKLLSNISATVQDSIYSDLRSLESCIISEDFEAPPVSLAEFFIERASIHLYYGSDSKARDDLSRAAQERSFHFALTGRLGKRTRYQQKELSQLVVLAARTEPQIPSTEQSKNMNLAAVSMNIPSQNPPKPVPEALHLNDDTLLESTDFTKPIDSNEEPFVDSELPEPLRSLDPGNQPFLEPLDAIILLTTASSITNTSPAHGLTREETLPYVERVLSGGSMNWQIYTQALLVRSRIEGYKSRTVERGALQLQAIVDQVIVDTTQLDNAKSSQPVGQVDNQDTPTFLPRPKQSESAFASERLLYIHQLDSPPRWKLESELADRWSSLGALRTALEIYERLQMWAEVALCWAANDREDKARKILRHQLYNPVITKSLPKLLEDEDDSDVGQYRVERDPLPADAPRLFCILADLEKSVSLYERAWEISNHRYARAQRGLGKYFSSSGDLQKADDAYDKSLKVNPQNHAIWFALGCIRLQTKNWHGAVEAFGRAVQVEDTDAESWSNLAIALLNIPPNKSSSSSADTGEKNPDPPKELDTESLDPRRHIREAFVALKRAASLKRESFRIWQNLLSVSVKLSPPPYTDIVIAQTRLIELLGYTEGERCVDAEIIEALVAHLISITPSSPPTAEPTITNQTDAHSEVDGKPAGRVGFERMMIDLVQKKITPLITSSRRLWLIVAKLSLHLGHPAAALSIYEKAWRATLNQPGWDAGNFAQARGAWGEVVSSTVDLVDAYCNLGERTRESGMGAGESVCKEWKFKARSAIRSVQARAREAWEGDEGFEILSERLEELKKV